MLLRGVRAVSGAGTLVLGRGQMLRRGLTRSGAVFARKKRTGGAGTVVAPGDLEGKRMALETALGQIEASFGRGAVMRLGDRASLPATEVISTGSLALDAALGVGGLPRGRVVEIYGPESSGKTTLALHTIAEAQKQGGSCCFIDVEHAIDPTYARALGVQVDDLLLSQPDAGEQALEIADTLVRSGSLDVVVVDSVAALVPKSEIEGEMGDHHVALQARLMSQALRKLTASLSKSRTLLIFINQIRSKVGVLFGSPDVTSGGNALKFYSSVRLEIRRGAQLKRGDEVYGNATKVKVVKNKLAPPFRVAEFDMLYGEGISTTGEIIDIGVNTGTLHKAGAWYAIPHDTILLLQKERAMGGDKVGDEGDEEKSSTAPPTSDQALEDEWEEVMSAEGDMSVAQGKDKTRAWLEERPAVAKALRGIILQAVQQGDVEVPVDHE